MSSHQLYKLARPGLEIFSHLDPNGVAQLVPAPGIPMMFWPDGHWCIEINLFLDKLRRKGFSLKNNGGSLRTYAAHLSLLVRSCYENQIDFSDIGDARYTQLLNALEAEKEIINGTIERRRTPSTVRRIGAIWLEFLSFYAEWRRLEGFIGPCGIQAERRKRSGNGRDKQSESWWHHAFPPKSAADSRSYIPRKDIDSLKAAVRTLGGSYFLRSRRYVMLLLLEITGARRMEISLISTRDIYAAVGMEHPELLITSVKEGRQPPICRRVPITVLDLKFILDFIEFPRRQCVKRTCDLNNDNGSLLISETTGFALNPNTITQEIFLLKRAAGIKTPASPQLFRHRYITKLFITFIEYYRFQNEREFKNLLITSETFKKRVILMTGHRSTESVSRYIHMAFDELSALKGVMNPVKLEQYFSALRHARQRYEIAIASGVPEGHAGKILHDEIVAAESVMENLSANALGVESEFE